jgi:tight adherence protein B
MLNNLPQFQIILTNTKTILWQILNTLTTFVSNNSILIYSLLIGFLSFLIFSIIAQSQLIPRSYKKLFLSKNSSKTNSLKYFQTKIPFWRKISTLSNFYETYQWADLPFTYEFFLTIGLSLFTIIFIFSLTTFSFFLAIILAVVFTYLYFFTIKILAKKNHSHISEQLPFVLDTLSGSIQSGYSLPQALKFTAEEVGMPFNLFFKEILIQLDYNIPITKVFENTQKMTTNQEFKMVLDGLIMQNKMGGDIVRMLHQMADWTRQKNKLQKDIKAFTSQGRLSGAIIVLLWPISAVIFYFLNANYISILFTSDTGRMFLILSLFLEILGFAMIWKIIKIKL